MSYSLGAYADEAQYPHSQIRDRTKLVGLVCLIVVAALSAMSSAENRDGRSMPALQGAAAVDYLKQQGLYDSLISTAAAQSPFSFQAYLKASNTNAGDYFGFSVALAGDTAVIGAPRQAVQQESRAIQRTTRRAGRGCLCFFVRKGFSGSSRHISKLRTRMREIGSGYAVALSGETLWSGAPYEDSGSTGINGDGSDNSINASGAVYVFVRSGATWSRERPSRLSIPPPLPPPPLPDPLDQFGFSVAISGRHDCGPEQWMRTAAIRASAATSSIIRRSAQAPLMFCARRNGVEPAGLFESFKHGLRNQFGQSAGVSRSTVLVGARLEDR
ncbi:MAG: FG-GAP repeat protein [Acidobacteria bacterium]|nr:FG-GAP repeat protein [Acidobacteriota bacterium]